MFFHSYRMQSPLCQGHPTLSEAAASPPPSGGQSDQPWKIKPERVTERVCRLNVAGTSDNNVSFVSILRSLWSSSVHQTTEVGQMVNTQIWGKEV